MFYTRIEIPSDISNLLEIEGFIDSIMSDCSLPEHYRGIVSLPVMEAVRNAIVHGNGNDHRKKVRVTCQQKREKLLFSVSDEGNGFPFEQTIGNMTTAKTHGLSVIRSLCEEICFQQNGTVIAFSIPVPVQKKAPMHHFSTKEMASGILQIL